MKKKNKKLLIGVVLFLIVILPILLYAVRNQQLFRPRAAIGQATVNIVPLEISKNIGEPFTVEVHVNSDTIPLSGITVSLNANPGGVIVQNVAGATTPTDAFTDLIYEPTIDPYTFTVVSRKPTAQLPTGSVKVAQLTLVSYESGTHNLGVNTERSQAVGFNGTSEDVALTVAAGTQTAYTINGSLCKLTQCPNITLQHQLRSDNKYNIGVTWQAPTTQAQAYKIYHNTAASVPENNPDSSIAGISTTTSFTDTNRGEGFPGETNVHYNVDAYMICPGTPTPTPTQSQATITPTATPIP